MTDPPENVHIRAPSDKLNLVEGNTGPRLTCTASGEPQVQYRWYLIPSARLGSSFTYGANFSLASSISRNQPDKRSASSSIRGAGKRAHQLEPPSSSFTDSEQAINQATNKAFNPITTHSKGANDKSEVQRDEGLIELTGSTEQDANSAISVLDLSQSGLDRGQAGHYVCEASNRLGESSQSIYVNVQCEYSNGDPFVSSILQNSQSSPNRPFGVPQFRARANQIKASRSSL